jgi:hypothetical protein
MLGEPVELIGPVAGLTKPRAGSTARGVCVKALAATNNRCSAAIDYRSHGSQFSIYCQPALLA